MSAIDITDLRSTIIPKSDQLNAEQLLGGPITITITDVRIGSSAEQPISVHYEGENGRPYKPCKTMRKVLIFAWGPDGREWMSRSLTLYNDPQVKFGGDEVGGIRISHMSDIERDIQVSLTATRGKKALHTIRRIAKAAVKAEQPARTERHQTLIAGFERAARERGFQAFKDAWELLSKEDKAAIGKTERDRIGAIGRQHDADTAIDGEEAA